MRYLSFLLKQCHSIMRLNLFGNYMDDYDLSDLLAVLIKPTAVFESVHGGQDDESLRSDTADFLCNQSITDLNIGRNKIGRETVKTLTNIFKTNPVIAVLRLEVCPEIGPRDWKTWCHALRLYNSSLTDLVLLNNKLTVKACEHIASVFSSLETRLEKLRLPMCDLRDLHGAALAKHLGSARFLRLLDLSGNNLGDSGAEAIATILRGQVTAEGVALPPLEELDLNSCGLQPPGCAKIIAALATRQMIRIVDLSNNVIGPTNDELLKYLPDVAVVDLRLHYCQVKSAMASSLFELIAHRSRTHVGDPSNHISLVRGKLLEHLRFLGLAGNEIGDSAAPKLFELLDCNISLEILDLGFNSFTMNSMEYFQFATRVTSESPEEKKVYPLHVNLIGNKCDPYLLEAPGMARSKFNLHFGTNPNLHDPSAEGYAHIESRVRGKFFVQKQMEELYRQTFPAKPFNSLT